MHSYGSRTFSQLIVNIIWKSFLRNDIKIDNNDNILLYCEFDSLLRTSVKRSNMDIKLGGRDETEQSPCLVSLLVTPLPVPDQASRARV